LTRVNSEGGEHRRNIQRLEPYSHPRAQLLLEPTAVLRFHRLNRGHASQRLSRIVEGPVKIKSRESGIARRKTVIMQRDGAGFALAIISLMALIEISTGRSHAPDAPHGAAHKISVGMWGGSAKISRATLPDAAQQLAVSGDRSHRGPPAIMARILAEGVS
jgi:hypothetical protein